MGLAGEHRAALDIRGLRKDFAVNDGRVTALQDINLTVHQGEFISIIGSSGAARAPCCGSSPGWRPITRVTPNSRAHGLTGRAWSGVWSFRNIGCFPG